MSAAPAPSPEVPGDFIDLISVAYRLGGLRWVEERLFEVVGGWVPMVVEPGVKGRLASISLHHGWHVELLAGVLPSLPNVEGLTPDGFTVAPASDDDGGLGRLVADTRALPGDAPAGDRLEHLRDRALPALVDGYRSLASGLSPVGDGPAIRVLGVIERDLLDDQRSLLGAD
jgi:hypothetical protein